MASCHVAKIPFIYDESIPFRDVAWQIIEGTLVDSNFKPIMSEATLISFHTDKVLSAVLLQDNKLHRVTLSYDNYMSDDITEVFKKYPPRSCKRKQYVIPLSSISISDDSGEVMSWSVKDILYNEFDIKYIQGYHRINECAIEIFSYNHEEQQWDTYECIMSKHMLEALMKDFAEYNIIDQIPADELFMNTYVPRINK